MSLCEPSNFERALALEMLTAEKHLAAELVRAAVAAGPLRRPDVPLDLIDAARRWADACVRWSALMDASGEYSRVLIQDGTPAEGLPSWTATEVLLRAAVAFARTGDLELLAAAARARAASPDGPPVPDDPDGG